MKVALYGKNGSALEKILREKGVAVVDRNKEDFDLLISYGGDGAMLGAELAYPERLKMPVRDVETAPHCPRHSLESQIDALLAGELRTTRMMKLVGMTGNVKRYAINDIFIHNMNNVSALRYQVKIDDDIYAREVVGDGVGVSTVHGSTAYYRSITHGSFRVGIGIAFSNSTELLNHLVGGVRHQGPDSARPVRTGVRQLAGERQTLRGRHRHDPQVRQDRANARTRSFHVSGVPPHPP